MPAWCRVWRRRQAPSGTGRALEPGPDLTQPRAAGTGPCKTRQVMKLHLRLSDTVQAQRPDRDPLPLATRDAALLAWLAVEGPTHRDRLAGLLWPGSGAAQARTTLRQRLFQLKRLLDVDVATGSPLLCLAPGVEHD